MRSGRVLSVAGLALAFFAATPAAAVLTTFATYTAIGRANFRLVNSGNAAARTTNAVMYSTSTPTGTAPGAALVNFSFLQPVLAPFVTNVQARWTFNGNVAKNSPAINTGGFLIQSGVSSSFSIVSTSAITVSGPGLTTTTYAVGSNLLSGVFTGGSIIGGNGGTAGTSFASGTPASGVISFTSDFLTFGTSTILDRAQSLTAVTPSFGVAANGAMRSFRAVASGQFSADPVPSINAAIPEPANWMMLMAGFGLVGAASRHRRHRIVAA